ncbi:hypothetical protein BDN67DRAFT_917192, partial [Paxillus ammoniavirescens]
MSGIYPVPKLSDMNWVEFKNRTVASLTARGLSRHLSGTIKAPKALPVSEDGTKTYLSDGTMEASETNIENNLVFIEAYAQKEALAQQQLYATVPNSIMIQAQSKHSIAEIWKVICTIY